MNQQARFIFLALALRFDNDWSSIFDAIKKSYLSLMMSMKWLLISVATFLIALKKGKNDAWQRLEVIIDRYIAKICLDALNVIAYPDDSQVTCLLVMKFYDEQPRVEITLEKVNKPTE